MSVPKSVIRFSKNGIEYVSNVEHVEYTIHELTIAAMRDVGKFIVRECNKKAQKLRGLKKSKRVRGSTSIFAYWARKREADLQLGFGNLKQGKDGNTWYGQKQELGSFGMKRLGILTETVRENIPTIREIESKYLTAITNDEPVVEEAPEDGYNGGGDD